MLTRSAMVLAVVLLGGAADDEKPATLRPVPAVPADYKLVIALYGVAKEPLSKSELVVHKGRGYLFNPGPPLEVVIHDPLADRLEIIDLKRRIRTEISFKSLEEYGDQLHKAISTATAKREALGGKGNLIAAAMSRDLIDPRFSALYDPATHRLRLTNPTIEVEARGEPDPDESRLLSIQNTLAALARMDSVRDPQDVPPFPRLDTLRALMTEHRLRPTELAFVFRLAGVPRKLRWTYRMEPTLTKRELEAIATVEAIYERSRFARFKRYGPSPRDTSKSTRKEVNSSKP